MAKGIARPDAVPSSPIESDSYTSALLQVTNGGQVQDGSGTGKTWILTGSPSIITGRKVTNTGGVTVADSYDSSPAFPKKLNFSGGQQLDIAASTDMDLASCDSTVDFFMVPFSVSGYRWIFSTYGNRFDMFIQDGELKAYFRGTVYSTGVTVAANTRYHGAICTASGCLHLFLDGVLSGTPFSVAYDSPTTPSAVIGNQYTGTSYRFIGQIGNLRITKGLARWTRDFTPPERPY